MPPVLFPALLLFELELARFLGLALLPRPDLMLQLALLLLELQRLQGLGADAGSLDGLLRLTLPALWTNASFFVCGGFDGGTEPERIKVCEEICVDLVIFRLRAKGHLGNLVRKLLAAQPGSEPFGVQAMEDEIYATLTVENINPCLLF